MTHVRYIDKTREYYRAEGYSTEYRWAHNGTTPFTPVPKPLRECRVGLVTTSEMVIQGTEPTDDVARPVYALPMATPVEELYSVKASFDKYETTLDDVDAYLPLTHLHDLVAEGQLAGLAPRFQIVFSQYSQRRTNAVDAPEILRQMREDSVDVAVLAAV